MKTYTDKYGRIHDKPTDGVKASSNNGWVYSAVADKLGMPLKLNKSAGNYCATFLVRHPRPTDEHPPISRDEILGLASLGFLKPVHIRNWSFSPFVIPRFNPFKLIKQLAQLVDWKSRTLKHRNTFWKEELDQIYRFAFSVPLSDRHFLNQCWGKYNLFWYIIHILSHRKQPENRSSRMLRFLKTGQDLEAVVNYFGEEHPVSRYAR
jgi:hypothetical protein